MTTSTYYLCITVEGDHFLSCELDKSEAERVARETMAESGYEGETIIYGPVRLLESRLDASKPDKIVFTGDIYAGGDMDKCFGAAVEA